jgi:hypothetical protein
MDDHQTGRPKVSPAILKFFTHGYEAASTIAKTSEEQRQIVALRFFWWERDRMRQNLTAAGLLKPRRLDSDESDC